MGLKHILEHCRDFIHFWPERMGEQGLIRCIAIAMNCCFNRQQLVGFNLCDQAKQTGGSGSVGSGSTPLRLIFAAISRTQSPGHSLTAPLLQVLTM